MTIWDSPKDIFAEAIIGGTFSIANLNPFPAPVNGVYHIFSFSKPLTHLFDR